MSSHCINQGNSTNMNTLKKLGYALIACASLGLGMSPIAQAADVIAATSGQENHLFYATDAAVAYTNSTVTPSDVTELTVTIPATRVPIARQYIRTCFYADATKATSTTGTLTVNVSGSDVTASARTISSAAARGSIVGCHTAARATALAIIVKLRGVSGDTALFTVHNAQMIVEVLYKPV